MIRELSPLKRSYAIPVTSILSHSYIIMTDEYSCCRRKKGHLKGVGACNTPPCKVPHGAYKQFFVIHYKWHKQSKNTLFQVSHERVRPRKEI